MLKDLILKSESLLSKENDNLPLFMRGELEVIERDKDNNIISYQKDHNVVTDFMKHEMIHMLAGDIFSVEEKRLSGDKEIYTTVQLDIGNHSATLNSDGMLFSQRGFFYTTEGLKFKFVSPIVDPSFTAIPSSYICSRYPVKMLFGTGEEFTTNSWSLLEETYGGSLGISKVLGFSSVLEFNANIDNNTNYYSNTFSEDGIISKCRTVQPINTAILTNDISPSSTYGIKGAIKNCLIESKGDETAKYDTEKKMAKIETGGIGRPSFIYAERTLSSVREDSINASPGFIKIGKSDAAGRYDNKLVFSVIMPRTSGFYPYNGYILKEAGLFSDSLFKIKNQDVIDLIEGNITNRMPCGILLAKRNISPILKTEDNSIEFIWSIYISTT